jgi:hypothetical protein
MKKREEIGKRREEKKKKRLGGGLRGLTYVAASGAEIETRFALLDWGLSIKEGGDHTLLIIN